jgi:hypothetical protein
MTRLPRHKCSRYLYRNPYGRDDNSFGPVFGKNFLLDPEGAIVPFEYTTSPCEAPSKYPGLVEKFAREHLVSNAANVFGLCTDPRGPEPYTEFELAKLRCAIYQVEDMLSWFL